MAGEEYPAVGPVFLSPCLPENSGSLEHGKRHVPCMSKVVRPGRKRGPRRGKLDYLPPHYARQGEFVKFFTSFLLPM